MLLCTSFLLQRVREEKLSQTYATVKEITGIEDQRVIDEAISACRTKDGSYKVEDVVSMLVQDDSLRRRQVLQILFSYIRVWGGSVSKLPHTQVQGVFSLKVFV